jgi:hypothetical protein
MKLEPHPLAKAIPPMTEDEFDELVDDIEAVGLRDPICIYEGKILDGWHRYRAMKKLGRQLQDTMVFDFDPKVDGKSPEAFVLSRNVKRRHLTKDQLAMFAAEEIAAMPKGKAGRPKKEDPDHDDEMYEPTEAEIEAAIRESALGAEENQSPIGDSFRERSEKAAKAAGVSRKKVDTAHKVLSKSPELAEKVKIAEITLVDAEKEVAAKQGRAKKAKPFSFRARDLESYVTGHGGGLFQLGHIVVAVAVSKEAKAQLDKLTKQQKWPWVFEELNEEKL